MCVLPERHLLNDKIYLKHQKIEKNSAYINFLFQKGHPPPPRSEEMVNATYPSMKQKFI